ncbi:MAG TPA: sigma-70 family RNA polymerase sigma factor [Actinomycetota bacterium]|nr:sigma-70 family RNA polymerase sigma factor [Actinomycetota bacterium]
MRTSRRTSEKVGALYDAHIAGAVRFAYLVCGDASLAQDLAHDAFVRVTSKLGALRSQDKVAPYLRTAIVNGYRSHLRKLQRERRYLEKAQSVRAAEQPDVAMQRDVREALQLLPPRRRAAVVLRYYEDMTEQQTADVLGCSVPAVKALVARGLDTLRGALEGEVT